MLMMTIKLEKEKISKKYVLNSLLYTAEKPNNHLITAYAKTVLTTIHDVTQYGKNVNEKALGGDANTALL